MENFYSTSAWRELRSAVIARDQGRCTVSRLLGGACSETLHVHHIESVEDRWDLRLDPDNCATACSSHHPVWEALRRWLLSRRQPQVKPCVHRHPYPTGREECLRRRMREAGLLEDRQLQVA